VGSSVTEPEILASLEISGVESSMAVYKTHALSREWKAATTTAVGFP
jgi:hypothetical protein